MRIGKLFNSTLLIISFLIIFPRFTIADPLDTWHLRYSSTFKTLNAVAYGDGTFVAVGDGGTILSSSDGITWVPRTSGTSTSLNGVTYGEGTFVAVGYHGTILISPDGETWTPRTAYSGTTETLFAIAYGKGIFVAVGTWGTVLKSPDGYTWTARTLGTVSSLPHALGFGNGTFVSVGLSGDISTSPDGVTWIERKPPHYFTLYGVAYGNSCFVAVGNLGTIFTSPNGVTWTERNSGTSNTFYGVAYGNSSFVAVGDDDIYIYTSPDGVVWTPRNPGISNLLLYGVTYGEGTFVAVGVSDFIVQSDPMPVSYTVTASVGGKTAGGSVTPSSRDVDQGSEAIFTVTTNTGYTASVSEGTLVGNTWTIPNVTSSHTATVTFTVITCTVITSVVNPTGGSIMPPSQSVNYGGKATFTVTTNPGYSASVSEGTFHGTTWTIPNVTSTRTVIVTFTWDVISLQSPLDYSVFSSSALINLYQSQFSWIPTGTFTKFTILFSISPTDFTTQGIKIAGGNASGTRTSWTPSISIWKNIMKSSNNSGIIRPIYWKVVGTKADRTTVESEVRSFSIGTPQTVTINAPLNGTMLNPATPPIFDFTTDCNTKFRLEISSLSDFSVSTKVKAFNFTVTNPNLVLSLQKTLSSSQWTGVKKLVGTGTGYFRIRAWDAINRETASETKSFTIQ